VLSRGSILRTLENPPDSLEDEIRRFYLSPPSPEGVETEDAMDHDRGQGEGSSGGQGGGTEKTREGTKERRGPGFVQPSPPTIPTGNGVSFLARVRKTVMKMAGGFGVGGALWVTFHRSSFFVCCFFGSHRPRI